MKKALNDIILAEIKHWENVKKSLYCFEEIKIYNRPLCKHQKGNDFENNESCETCPLFRGRYHSHAFGFNCIDEVDKCCSWWETLDPDNPHHQEIWKNICEAVIIELKYCKK